MIVLLLHCDGEDGSTNLVDNSYPPNAITALGGARISTSHSKFGNSSGLLEGGGEKNILRLHFNDTAGSSIFTDSSPVHTTLVPSGSPIISSLNSKWDNNGLFDGTSSLFDASNRYIIRSNMSFDLFVYFTDLSGRQNFLTLDVSHEKGLEFYFESDVLTLRFADTILSNPWTPLTNTWYHLSISRDGAYVYIRIDGIEVAKKFRKTGLVIEDSKLSFANPDLPLPIPIFFSRFLPGKITAIEFNGQIPASLIIKAIGKQNNPIVVEDFVDSSNLSELAQSILGLSGRIYLGLSLSSIDGSQISLDDIFLHYESPESYDGSLTKGDVIKYEGEEDSDVFLIIPTPPSLPNLSDTLFRIDQTSAPYSVIYSNLTNTAIVLHSMNRRDNLTIHRSTGSTHWSSTGLHGKSLDWNGGNGGVIQQGYWHLQNGYWTTDQSGGLSSSTDSSSFTFMSCVCNLGTGAFKIILSIHETNIEINFDDSLPILLLNGREYLKPSLPWGNNEHLIVIQKYLDNIIFKIDGIMIDVITVNLPDVFNLNLQFIDFEKNSKVGVRSYYTGPLVQGNIKTYLSSDVEHTYLTNNPVLCMGYMLYAGTPELDSVGILYIDDNHIFLETEILDIPLPPNLNKDSKIFGFQDMMNSSMVLFYGSGSQTYIYEGDWRKIADFELVDLYKDRWGEGIIFKRNQYAYWAQLLERENGKLVLTGMENLFAVAPTNGEYKLESTIDYRKRKGTIPWMWMRKK